MLSKTDWINQNYRIEKKTYGDGTVEYNVFDRKLEETSENFIWSTPCFSFSDRNVSTYKKNFLGWSYPATETLKASDRVNKFLEQKYKTHMDNRVISKESVKYKL
jgi:hypothetical protein